MLELLARSEGGRVLAWTRGDHVVRTPLLLARAGIEAAVPEAMGVLAPIGASVASAGRPIVESTGGFHVVEPQDAPGPDTWARVTVARPRRMMGQLSLRRASAVVADEDDEAREADLDPAGETLEPVLADPDGELAVYAEAVACARDPAVLVPRLLAARRAATPGRLLYTPGIGLVHQLGLLAYAGVDVFDTLAVERATLQGLYLTPEGAFEAAALKAPLCGCTTCVGAAPTAFTHADLLTHNLTALDTERRIVTGHIENGTLRELVEQRARAHPGTAAALRHLDRQWPHFAAQIPLNRSGRLHATTMDSLARPDVARYRQRLLDDYQPPSTTDVLLLLPCSAAKPYSRSKSHRVFKRVLSDLYSASLVHEVMVTSPLGIVPRELENTWPAAHYDVPVTGVWDREERAMIREQVASLLAKGTYRQVIAHLGQNTYDLVADLLPEDHVHTGTPHPTDYAARDKMRYAIKDATQGISAPPWPHRRLADARAIATWQFGPAAAEALFGDAGDVSGRPPMLRVYGSRGKKDIIATFVPDKGLFVLTMEGARRLYEAGCAKTVEIDDFTPRGTLFSVGVRDADPRIGPGDEVLLTHNGAVRGVGTAVATGAEMRAFGRGPAVEVRHHA